MSYSARIRAFAAGWLMGKTAQERRHLSVLLLAVALYAFHYLVWCWPQPFYIEDSAISFSYARNFMEGWGWVPFSGSERVEGFSNFLWTVLIGIFWKLGAEPWYSSKILGFVFGVITLGLSYLIARRVRGEELDGAPLLPPLLLAASTQFVVWNASGLENSLFNLLLAGGIYATLLESEQARIFPWSAVSFLGLALTRPEGIAYAAVGLLTRFCVSVWRGGVSPTEGQSRWRHWAGLLLWIVVLAAPYAAFIAWRYDYFGWLWPNTYYAKEKAFRPFNWGGDGWPKLREYMHYYGIIYASPAIALGVMGFSRGRRILAALMLAILAGMVLWDGRAGIPAGWQNPQLRSLGAHWSEYRVYYILGVGVVAGLFSLGRKGWEARATLWACYCTALFFQIFSGGDWMKGYRWFSLASVPQFILLGVGLYSFAELVPKAEKLIRGVFPLHTLYVALPTIALICANIPQSYDFVMDAETAVRDVHQRVRYMTGVQKKLGLDRVSLLDVDMGAHLWYTDWYIMDIAGLIDVPVARHDWEKPFGTDYVLQEYRPDFAHVHGSWARTTHLTDLPEFKSDYLEIPGFPTGGRTLHVGNHIRKDLLVRNAYEGVPGREVHFLGSPAEVKADPKATDTEPLQIRPDSEVAEIPAEEMSVPKPGEVILDGWDLPAPMVAPGGKLYLSTSWTALNPHNFRVLAYFSNGSEARAAEMSPGFDWYKPERWKAGEHILGNWTIPIPEDLPPGEWKLGLVLVEEKTGVVLPSLTPSASPQFMKGEQELGTFSVVTVEAAHAQAQKVLEESVAAAQAGNCEASEEAWKNARRHIARDAVWHEAHLPEWETAMVRCLINRANALSDIQEKAVPMMLAWKLTPYSEELLAAATPLGQQLEDLGDKLALAGDWEGGFRAFSAAVKVDARRSWARRKAEECRDHRLKLKMKAFRWEKPVFPYEEPPPAPVKRTTPAAPPKAPTEAPPTALPNAPTEAPSSP